MARPTDSADADPQVVRAAEPFDTFYTREYPQMVAACGTSEVGGVLISICYLGLVAGLGLGNGRSGIRPASGESRLTDPR